MWVSVGGAAAGFTACALWLISGRYWLAALMFVLALANICLAWLCRPGREE